MGKIYSVVLTYGGKPKISTRDLHGVEVLPGKKIKMIYRLLPPPVRAMVQACGGHAKTICMMNLTAC